MFKPEAREVALARDARVRTKGNPFPGFREDGAIAIGYFTNSLQFLVVWASMFEIEGKKRDTSKS